MKRKVKLSKVSTIHYIKLIYRSILFLLAFYWYISNKFQNLIISISLNDLINEKLNWIIFVIAIVYTIEMLLRLFPSKYDSPGSQKQFKKNYQPTGKTKAILHDNHATVIVTLLWLILNGIFGILYMKNIFDEGILLLISLLYGVCDMTVYYSFVHSKHISLKIDVAHHVEYITGILQ